MSHVAYLNAGEQDFGIGFPAGPFNLDWIEITPETSSGRTANNTSLSLEEEIEVLAYPNPANNFVNLSGLEGNFSSLKLFNLAGKMKGALDLRDNQSYKLDISNLQKGIYLIQLIGKDKSKTVKIIKQ
ncbi:T9SS type A sorting domain-containing protein [Flammeovirga aprica JL-4]|uniref:T9SS type A sorting domain-containing protein n=1 Tax=Flammeovirga aprica JL-4 TaxID=694437 RepID=A0A7X9P1H0_9BACT|nr:T9SS type A sorting domain-containing protein [Flammeovirga aprica JL-4]